MSEARIDLIQRAFNKLDRNRNGVVTVSDLKGVYNVKHHPKFQNGEMTEKQLLKLFLQKFDTHTKDDQVESFIIHFYNSCQFLISNKSFQKFREISFLF